MSSTFDNSVHSQVKWKTSVGLVFCYAAPPFSCRCYNKVNEESLSAFHSLLGFVQSIPFLRKLSLCERCFAYCGIARGLN